MRTLILVFLAFFVGDIAYCDNIKIFEDRGSLKIGAIKKLDESLFQDFDSFNKTDNYNPKNTYWLKILLRTEGIHYMKFVEIKNAFIDEVTFYEIKTRPYLIHSLSRKSKSFPGYVYFVLMRQSEQVVYVKIKDKTFPAPIHLILRNGSQAFVDAMMTRNFIFNAQIVLYVAFFIGSWLVLYLITNRRSIFFSVGILLGALVYFVSSGWGAVYFWPNTILFDSTAAYVIASLLFLLILSLRSIAIKKIYSLNIWVMAILLIICFSTLLVGVLLRSALINSIFMMQVVIYCLVSLNKKIHWFENLAVLLVATAILFLACSFIFPDIMWIYVTKKSVINPIDIFSFIYLISLALRFLEIPRRFSLIDLERLRAIDNEAAAAYAADKYKTILRQNVDSLRGLNIDTIDYIIKNIKHIVCIRIEKKKLAVIHGHTAVIQADNLKRHLDYMPLDMIEERLRTNDMVRIHRSTLINPTKVIRLVDDIIHLEGNIQLSVGNTYLENVKEKFGGAEADLVESER
jgi:hypothetical protein